MGRNQRWQPSCELLEPCSPQLQQTGWDLSVKQKSVDSSVAHGDGEWGVSACPTQQHAKLRKGKPQRHTHKQNKRKKELACLFLFKKIAVD